jgi:hypothetical protein
MQRAHGSEVEGEKRKEKKNKAVIQKRLARLESAIRHFLHGREKPLLNRRWAQ